MEGRFNLNKEVFTINLNWAAILAFTTFWSYGFFGALTEKDFKLWENIVITAALFGIFILFLYLWRSNNSFKDSLIIKNKDILVFASLFLIMLAFSFGSLTASLVGDQLAHAQQSQIHGITFIYFLTSATNIFNNVIFSDILYLINLLTIGAGLAIYALTKNKNFILKVIIFSIAFLLFRILIIGFGGNAGPHPPFRLFPLWITSSLFSSADFSFRLSQFVGLIGLMWIIQRIANKNLSFINSYFFALAAGTIPVLWHVGILAEQSVWTSILWTILLLYTATYDNNGGESKFNYIRWISAVSIFALMRQSAFVALAPIFILLLIDLWRQKDFNFNRVFILAAPILAMAPFILSSVFKGTPASYIPGAADYIPNNASSFERVWIAVKSGMAVNAIINSVRFPWVIFSIFAILFNYKKPLKALVVIIFFMSGFYIFYSITPGLWGIGRYQAEYVIPFVILGFFLFINFISGRYYFARKFLPLIFIPLIIYNFYVFKNLPYFNKPVDKLKITFFSRDIKRLGEYSILSEFSHEYKAAFAEAKKSGYAGKTFVAGVTYGVFSEILNNFTVSEVVAEKNIYQEIKNAAPADFPVEVINENKKIQLVFISDIAAFQKLLDELENYGWKKWKEFRNDEYGSTIFGLIRGNNDGLK